MRVLVLQTFPYGGDAHRVTVLRKGQVHDLADARVPALREAGLVEVEGVGKLKGPGAHGRRKDAEEMNHG